MGKVSNNIALKQRMTAEELAILKSEMEGAKKSKGVAYLLWFFFCNFAIHRFYIGDYSYAFAMVGLHLGLFVLTDGYSFLLTGLWVFVDVFFVGRRIDEMYYEKERRVISEMGLREDGYWR